MIRKNIRARKVFTFQFMCMETIIQSMEFKIKQDLTEVRSDFGLDSYRTYYRITRLLDLIASFYSARRLEFTPLVYLFMIKMKDDVVSITLDRPLFRNRVEPHYKLCRDHFIDMLQTDPNRLFYNNQKI
jgi:hypothetical protein